MRLSKAQDIIQLEIGEHLSARCLVRGLRFLDDRRARLYPADCTARRV